MSGDFWNPLEGIADGDPYRNDSLARRYSQPEPLPPPKKFHAEDQTLFFDPRRDYIAGGILQREEILKSFEELKELATQPGARWRAEDHFDKQSGMIRHTEKLIVNTRVVSEHITLSIHEHQHLIDSGRSQLAIKAKQLQQQEQTPEVQTALTKVWRLLNTPINLKGEVA